MLLPEAREFRLIEQLLYLLELEVVHVGQMVLIYSDIEKNGIELLAKGRELADKKGTKVVALVTGPDGNSTA